MAKVTVYECDGITAAGTECEQYAEMPPGQFPEGWLTVTLEARIHNTERRVVGMGRGRDRREEHRPEAADWLHLCPSCAQVRGGDAVLAALLNNARHPNG